MLVILEAHKLIFALHSDHFKNAFYGSGTAFKESEEGVVVVKETTKEAFEDFVGFNYEKRIEFEKKSLAELFEILNLAERYQVKELKDRVSKFMKNFTLTMSNVVDVATAAKEFSHFENLSNDLYASCVAFVGAKFTDAQSVLTFVQGNEDKMTVMKLLQDIKNPGGTCRNCKQNPCRNKSYISANDLLEPGTLVLTNPGFALAAVGWRQKYKNQLCKVVNKNGGRVTITWSNPPVPADSDVSDPYNINLIDNYFLMFKYACDE